MGGHCAYCNSTDDLEFDHIDPETKKFTLAKSFASWSDQRIEAELKKCQLLCKECHFEKTLKDVGKERWKHGTLSGYRYCKCELCKKAKSNWSKEYKKRTSRKP